MLSQREREASLKRADAECAKQRSENAITRALLAGSESDPRAAKLIGDRCSVAAGAFGVPNNTLSNYSS